MSSVRNECKFIGNLGQTPEKQFLADGTTYIATAGLAVNEPYRDSDGEWVDVTNWVNLSWFRKAAESAASYLKKGDLVAVTCSYSNTTKETDKGPRTYHNFTVNGWSKLASPGARKGDAVEEEEETEEFPF